MNDLNTLLGALASTPNWKYQLGISELGPQYAGIASNYELGKGQNANTAQANLYNYLLGQGANENQAAQIANQLTLGQGQNANQAAQIANEYNLGTTAQKNQLDEFLKQFGLQKNQQAWQQNFTQNQANIAQNNRELDYLRSLPGQTISPASATALAYSNYFNPSLGYVPAASLPAYYNALGSSGVGMPDTARMSAPQGSYTVNRHYST